MDNKKKKGLKDPASALTHIGGAVAALFAAVPLIIKSTHSVNSSHTLSMVIFILSMIALYSASGTYHSLDISEKTNKHLRKLDHSMIFVLIAGTYTPICSIVIGGTKGLVYLCIIWGFALIGIIFKLFWITCPKWVSSVLYIAMGWVCIFAFPDLLSKMSTGAFLWLLIGGIIYTVGGVIYALKLSIFNNAHKSFGSHEIFHLFCLGGSFCHFILMYCYLI